MQIRNLFICLLLSSCVVPFKSRKDFIAFDEFKFKHLCSDKPYISMKPATFKCHQGLITNPMGEKYPTTHFLTDSLSVDVFQLSDIFPATQLIASNLESEKNWKVEDFRHYNELIDTNKIKPRSFLSISPPIYSVDSTFALLYTECQFYIGGGDIAAFENTLHLFKKSNSTWQKLDESFVQWTPQGGLFNY